MPDFTTHHIVGQQVLPALPRDTTLAIAVRNYEAAYNWGLQGPDLLFYTKPVSFKRTVPHCASLLHKFSGELILTAAWHFVESRREYEDYAMLQAYLAGFVCHYMVDSIVHPYIYFLQEKLRKKLPKIGVSALHGAIERDIDAILYQYWYLEGVSFAGLKESYQVTPELVQAVSGLYGYLCDTLLNTVVTEEDVARAFRFSQRLYRYFYPQSMAVNRTTKKVVSLLAKKKELWRPSQDEKIYDILNDVHRPWYNVNVPDEVRYDSLSDLLKMSVRETIKVLSKEFSEQSFVNLPDNFHNGKP
ncbi:MAG: zinc dependent phospholipase C family protein [Peptococcaceae bacterium]|nr:zinc dependent phospholipase C family protein [Peptococcaceae bacterium]